VIAPAQSLSRVKINDRFAQLLANHAATPTDEFTAIEPQKNKRDHLVEISLPGFGFVADQIATGKTRGLDCPTKSAQP
jgi:hypothetical protein